ncbi:hypothetical protein AKJ40_03115 [candidate division MSBL1 archaeon SCGC-AAA259M10]|uniref:Peptidase S49 domain-containing protein n=1 Tax=candidate division MSBL1 archaeon SCGC-AAA259M10 TaxID=1698270 RepID=A0A133UZ38_9EURY|nr:hypothetical protein AKJ40_03115 [candidate division MSBL1 archaeon SCGC-AAA259M10]
MVLVFKRLSSGGIRRKDSNSKKLFKIIGILIVLALVAAGFYYLGSLDLGGVKVGKKPKVAVVNVTGVIENFQTAHRVSKTAKDKTVKAAVIKVNSPGGYVSPSFQLESAISKLAEEKPTVGAVGQLGASGAYLAVSAVDNLYVHHSSLVGALGVIAIWISYKEYYENKGIEHYVFKTGPHKDMYAPWRGPTENEKEMIRKEINRIEDRMLGEIIQNRPSLENNLPLSLVKGEIVRGFESVEINLAEGIIGTYEEAIEKAAEAADLSEGEYQVVRAENLTG